MSVLVATTDGCHTFTSSGTSSGDSSDASPGALGSSHSTALDGRSVTSLAAGPDASWFGVIDGNEIWERAADGTWAARATWDTGLSAIHAHGATVYVGTSDARLLRLVGDALSPVTSFDDAPGRSDWHAVGPPLHVRSMTSTSDGAVLLVNVHVGGILRSDDDGATWTPTIDVDADVHEVRAHPSDASFVVAAAAVGVCTSTNGGATWTTHHEGLTSTYARAVAFSDDAVLVSVSDGPFAQQSAVYSRPVRGGNLERVGRGLPADGLAGNVDTACLAARGSVAALADDGGNVWSTNDTSVGWSLLASALGDVRAVAIG